MWLFFIQLNINMFYFNLQLLRSLRMYIFIFPWIKRNAVFILLKLVFVFYWFTYFEVWFFLTFNVSYVKRNNNCYIWSTRCLCKQGLPLTFSATSQQDQLACHFASFFTGLYFSTSFQHLVAWVYETKLAISGIRVALSRNQLASWRSCFWLSPLVF